MPQHETELDGDTVTIHDTHHRATVGARDGRFGPKLEPDEPEAIEIDWIEGADGTELDVSLEQHIAWEKEIEINCLRSQLDCD